MVTCRVQCQGCKKIFDELEHVTCPHCGTCPKCEFKHPIVEKQGIRNEEGEVYYQ